MKKNKKGLIIGIVIIAVLACAAAVAFIFAGKMANQSGYTVKFELCTDLQTTTVLDRTVAPGSFLEEPEVYVTGNNEENWEISGWYREPEYETQWDFDFDTVDSDLTLYAKWETNPQCTVSFYTVESEEPVFVTTIRKGLVVMPCDEEFMGREVLGYYADKAMTKEFDFETKIEKDTDIFVDISEYVYFDAKMLSKWSICDNQTEVDNYEVATSLSEDEEIFTVSTKNGGYLWIRNLELDMHETSIIEVKMREVNDNYSGAFGGYVAGSYTVNGEVGASTNFGEPNTGSLSYARSAKPDEDGFYTYTCNISSLTPGLIYDVITGFRIDWYGVDKYTYEIKEIKTYVDEYAVSGEAFSANGINFNGLHLNTFTLMGDAETEVLASGDLRFGGPNGAYIYKKGLDITLGEEQIIRLTAKGDLKGGTIALFFFGEYTQDGKKGVTTDYSSEQKVFFVAGETDANGYTTYTADLSTIPGFKLNKVNGLRIDLYGEGTRTIDMKALKSYAPTAEEKQIAKAFDADGLDLKGAHFTTFFTMGDAKGSILDNGDYSFGGPNGVYLYRKNVKITLDDDQKIELKAKGDLKGGRIRLYLYGENTQDGKTGTTTDFNENQHWDFTAEKTDAEGYTTYTLNLDSIKGLKFNTIHGLRLDLYGEDTRTIEITSLKSVVPSKEEQEVLDSFAGKGLDFTGAHLAKFNAGGDAETNLLDNGDYSFGGPNGSMIYYKGMEITLEDDQIIVIKAKGSLNNGAIALFFYGDYTQNQVSGALEDYAAEHRVTFVPGETDAAGYTTYTADISSISGLHYDVLRGLRVDLYGEGTRTLEIKSLKSVAPSKEEEDIKKAFIADGLDFTGAHLAKFNVGGNAETRLLDNGDYRFGGPNGSMLYYNGMEITLEDDQIIELKAKGDLNNGAVALLFYGDYTQNQAPGTLGGYTAEHMVTFVPGKTDADGYTTYTADISSISGLHYDVLRGLRIDLYGGETRTLEIKSLKSVVPADAIVDYYVDGEVVYSQASKIGEATTRPSDDSIVMGHEILGYYSDEAFEKAFDFASELEEDTKIYVKVSDYLYFSPAMLKQFSVVAHTAGNATASTELVDDGVQFKGVHGSHIYKKNMNLDVKDTQVLEFTVNATVDVSAIDVWLYGTYTKDGQPYTSTVDDVNLRWRIIPDTTGEYVTYQLDLSESSSASGMVWEKITGIRIDILLYNVENIGIINIQSIKAVAMTNILNDGFDGETSWTYTDAEGSGTVPTQRQETVIAPNYIANIDFEKGSTASWGEHEYGSIANSGAFEIVEEADNKSIKYTSTEANDGMYWSQSAGAIEAGKTYTISLKCKGNGSFHIFTTGFCGTDALLKDWVELSDSWKTVTYEVTATEGNTSANTELFFKHATVTTLYLDDITITCGEAPKKEEILTEKIHLDFSNEAGYDNYWVKEGNGTPSYAYDNGAIKLTATSSGSNFYYYQPKDVYGTGNTYRISYKYKSDVSFSGFTLGFHSNTAFLWYEYGIPASSEWNEYTFTITTASTAGEMYDSPRIGFTPAGEGNVWIDDLTVEKVDVVDAAVYTQGIGTCITSDVAAEEDNVLYVRDYTKFETAVMIQAGVTYQYTFLMRNDATGSDFDLDVQVGGVKVADVVSGALAESTWTEKSGIFTATADATTFGFLRAGEGGVYIDDVVLARVGAGEEQPDNLTGLVVNGSFEDLSYDYTTDWRTQGSTGQMAVVEDPADANNRVLQFTATDDTSGVDYNAGKVRGFLEKDKTYTISFKYKGEAQFHIFTAGLIGEGHSLLDDWVPMSAGDWTTYACEITPTIDTTACEMQFYIKMATATGGTFYIDDFSIMEKTQ